jgi:hypothetical protein
MADGHAETAHATTRIAVLAGAASLAASAAVVVTALGDRTPLGAPRFWPWLLTGLQVLALWLAGRGLRWGWLLGGSVQVPWIAYAVATSQLGFIPGCAVSAAVQAHSYLRDGEPMREVDADHVQEENA